MTAELSLKIEYVTFEAVISFTLSNHLIQGKFDLLTIRVGNRKGQALIHSPIHNLITHFTVYRSHPISKNNPQR